jgi:hypothetical protein
MAEKKKYFLERPGSIRKLWMLLWLVCGLTLVPEFFIHRHPHFSHDHYFGFYAGLGFVACAVLIILAKGVGWLLKRREEYYD